MTLRELLKDRIVSCMTEQDLSGNWTTAEELDTMTDIDLFELYESHVFAELLK
jgi:hypothetical protein